MRNPFLVGDKIYLRPLEKADAAVLTPWFNDLEVTRHLRRSIPMNLAAEEDFIEGLYKNEQTLVLGIAARSDDRLIGVAGLHDVNARCRHAQFGIAIGDKSCWNKGHGTEASHLMVRHAFEVMNLNRVWLHVHADNPRGIRAYEKAGFRREGTLRQEFFVDGRYVDTIVMAVLRDEWTGVKAK